MRDVIYDGPLTLSAPSSKFWAGTLEQQRGGEMQRCFQSQFRPRHPHLGLLHSFLQLCYFISWSTCFVKLFFSEQKLSNVNCSCVMQRSDFTFICVWRSKGEGERVCACVWERERVCVCVWERGGQWLVSACCYIFDRAKVILWAIALILLKAFQFNNNNLFILLLSNTQGIHFK